MTRRVPVRKVGHLTKPGYRAGNSDRGDAAAMKAGDGWVDRDMQMTRDRVPINTHWPRLSHDKFAPATSRIRWSDVDWRTARHAESPDHFHIRTMRRALVRAHKLGLNVEVEAKCMVTADEFGHLADLCHDLWGDDWREHVNVKCLTTIRGWTSVLHAAYVAGFPTLALARGAWRTKRIDSPWITYTRGNVRTPKE